jgi:hypothetical protein
MARVPPLARLARWLIVLGLIVMLSAFGYPFLVRNAIDSQREIAADLQARLELLQDMREDMRTAKDSTIITAEIESTETTMNRVQQRMRRRQYELRDMWRFNGKGPLLLVAGLLFAGMGYRLHRFVEYGE